MSSEITLLVFKDNLASRTFKVPLRWVTTLGVLLGICLITTLGTTALALKFFRDARKGNPARVVELQTQLEDLKKIQTAPAAAPMTALPPELAGNVTQPANVDSQVPPHVPEVIPTIDLVSPTLFTGLPKKILPPPPKDTLPIKIDSIRTIWEGQSFKVSFNIHYSRGDGASQQGRIVLLARGRERILAYPSEVFTPAGSEYLLNPDKGEYFSVSRFREVQASFPTMRTRDAVSQLEIMILGIHGQLLIHQVMEIK